MAREPVESWSEKRDIWESLVRLCEDAKARGLEEAALAYGWSTIRLGDEALREMDRRQWRESR